MHFDPEKPIIVQADPSDLVSTGVLSQHDNSGILNPVAFYSKKHFPAQCNSEIHDKQLQAIIRCFKEWRLNLDSTSHRTQVLSNHRDMEYFITAELLNRHQAHGSEFCSQFNFENKYPLGKQGGKPDNLTRRSSDLPKEEDE